MLQCRLQVVGTGRALQSGSARRWLLNGKESKQCYETYSFEMLAGF